MHSLYHYPPRRV